MLTFHISDRSIVTSLYQTQVSRSQRYQMLLTGAVVALLAAFPAWAGDKVFVLADYQLDAVTAGGVSVISEGFSATAALGDQALTDSVTDAHVDPEGGLAEAFGLGVGTEGSQAIVDTSASGQDTTIIATTNGTADGVSYTSTPTLVSSSSGLTLSDSEGVVTSTAVGSAPESFTSGSSGISYADGTNQAISGAEGTGVDLSGSGSMTQVGTSIGGDGSRLEIQSVSTSQGSLFSVTEAGTTTSAIVSDIGIDTQAFAGTGSAGSGTSGVTTVIMSDGSGMIVRTSGLATQTGDALTDPAAQTSVSINGVPTTATVTGTSRTTQRSGISRSLTIRMITR